MVTVSYKAVLGAAWEAGLDDGDVRTAYVGRGSQGRECFGVRVEGLAQAMSFFAHLAAEDPETALQIADAARTDQLGLGMILYFPGYNLGDDPEEEP